MAKIMQGWLTCVRTKGRISAVEFRNNLKLNDIRECLQNKRLHRVGHFQRMEEVLVNVEIES